MPEWINSLNDKIDQAFELTHLPQLAEEGAGYVGRGFDSLVGTNVAPTVSRLGRDLPRMLAEAALTIPEAASGVGAPVAAATWLNRLRKLGQVAGYGGSAVGGYAATDSPLGALLAAGGLGLQNKLFLPEAFVGPFGPGLDVGGRGAALGEKVAGYAPRTIAAEAGSDLLSSNLLRAGEGALDAKTVMQRIVGGVGRGAADVGTGLGLSEFSRQGNMSVGPNAVGLDDPSRNPLTEENIAGNVVNSLPMMLGAVMATKGRFAPKQQEHLVQWMENRRKAEALQDGYDWQGPVSPVEYQNITGKAPMDGMYHGNDLVPHEESWGTGPLDMAVKGPETSLTARTARVLGAHLDVLRTREERGDPEAEVTRKEIKSILDGAAAGLDTDIGQAAMLKTLDDHQTKANTGSPQDPAGLTEFVQDINHTITVFNDELQRIRGVMEQEPPMRPPVVKDARTLAATQRAIAEEKRISQEKADAVNAERVSWHPNAAPLEVIQQLQKVKLLPEVTADWLKTEFNAEFNQSGDAEFAKKVVLQKAVNRLFDQVPKALELFKQLPRPDAPTQFDLASKATQRAATLDKVEGAYHTALSQLPDEVKQPILERSVEIRKLPTITIENGSVIHPEQSWRQAVIAAVKSYNPQDGTILMKTKKGYERVPFDRLVKRDDHGNYLYRPGYGTVALGEGGKGSYKFGGKTITEGNIEDLAKPGEGTPDVTDEEALKAHMVTESGQELAGMKQFGKELGAAEDVGAVKPVEDTLAAEDIPQTRASNEDVIKKKESLLKNLDTLSDDQLYSVAKGAFAQKTKEGTIPRRDPNEGRRRELFRPAFMAYLEDAMGQPGSPVGESGRKFLEEWTKTNQVVGKSETEQLKFALKRFFGHQTEVTFSGAQAGIRPDRQRLAYIVNRLTDPKVMEAVQGVGRTMSSVRISLTVPILDADLSQTKVVDEHGAPLRVYHGTRGVFDDFDLSKVKRPAMGYGFHFTESQPLAEKYADQTKSAGVPRVVDAFLDIKNPASESDWMAARRIVEGEYSKLPEYERNYDTGFDRRITEILKARGFDGMIYEHSKSMLSDKEAGAKTYVAFSPNQIKVEAAPTSAAATGTSEADQVRSDGEPVAAAPLQFNPEPVRTGAEPSAAPESEKNMPQWAREEMLARGLDPARPLNDVDLANPSVRQGVLADPTLSETQKASILATGSPKTPSAPAPVSPNQIVSSASGPVAGQDASVAGRIRDILTNTQPPGSFTGDVLKAFRSRLSTALGEQGYSGSLRDLYTEMAVAIAQTVPTKSVDFYRISGTEWGLATDRGGRGKLGLNLDRTSLPGQETKFVNSLLATLAHEISHIDTFILQGLVDEPDAFSERRRVHAENLRSLAEVLTPDEADSILRTVKDALVPKEFQTTTKLPNGRLYGTHDPDEFAAVLNELLAASLLRGKSTGFKNALEVLDYGPVEVREYANGTYRAIFDVLQGMKDSIEDPFIRQMAGKEALPETNKFFTGHAMTAVVDSAREASLLRESDKALTQARAYTASLSPGAASAPPLSSPAMWFRTQEQLTEGYRNTGLAPDAKRMPGAVEAIGHAAKFIESPWFSWFAPFAQRMEAMKRMGFDLARPMANAFMDVEAKISRYRSGILENFTVKGTDGKIGWDKENDLVRQISEKKTGPWRVEGVNRLSAWQQENGTKSMFVQDKNGMVVVNPDAPGAQAEWDKVRSRMSQLDQQRVMAGMVALDKTEQHKANLLIGTLNQSNAYTVAHLTMKMNRSVPYDMALQLGQEILAGYQQRNELALQKLIPPTQRGAYDTLLAGPEGLLATFDEVTKKLSDRPGYRTEQLPHDWIIRFQTPAGDVRFLSAPTEHKAGYLMRQLAKDGNVQMGDFMKKSDLKEFTNLDDAAELLEKYADREKTAWDRLVKSVETSAGSEVADSLKTYIPGAAVLQDFAKERMNQSLIERKGKVDRSRYDYIDGTMASAGRLAATITFRETRQLKDLILADPRAKAFPEFADVANSQFENITAPTSQWARELKLFSSAMLMGGSFASAVINASQSIVSLVPVLIQHDRQGLGPVGAWKSMFRATADASAVSLSKDWQARAAAVERADPKQWSLEDSKAALYARNVLDGGVNHGIILDNIFSSTDQKQMMLAKFGHGDYGPVTVGEMARSPVYLASQLSLKPFGWVEQFNNKISLMAGIEQGYAQGLRGDSLYDHAKLVKTLSTYGGGKANAPGLVPKLSGPYTRSAVGVVNNLQQYGYGVVSTYAQLLRDSLGQSKALDPSQRRQAQKALGTMMATQLAVGGALGLPFAAASLTVLEKVFGIPANQLVRQGLASLGSDEDQGAVIAETALNGIGNQMFGIDVSSRLGVSNLLGTSSYRGFNLQDMAGPTISVLGNAVTSLGLFAQGEPMKAAHALVPNSFRNLVALSDSKAKYGDLGIRDAGDNLLYQPTPSQAALYLAGFRPREVSQKRQAQQMLTFANDRASRVRGQELDGLGQSLLAGDPGPAWTYAQGLRYTDPTVNPQDVLRSVVQRSVDSMQEKDLLASGPSANEGARRQIAGTFGSGVVTRQSEVQRALLAAQLGAGLGLAPESRQFARAALADSLVQSQGMPRSQAVRLAEFLQ